jgi:hypothetical protein
MKVEIFDIGEHVECDLCSKNFTNSDAIGGFLFESKGVCPDCSEKFLKSVKEYGEEQYIKEYAKPDETFKDFILRIRDGNNMVTFTTLKKGESL